MHAVRDQRYEEPLQRRVRQTLHVLHVLRDLEPRRVARHEARIRFGVACSEEVQRSAGAIEPKPERVRIALQILNEHLRRAEACIELIIADLDLPRVA